MVGETAKSTGGASGNHRILAILLVMILLHTSHCGASVAAAADASIFQDNVTSLNYQGHIIDMDEPHLWFDSEISRMLAPKPPVTPKTLVGSKLPVSPCGRPPRYTGSCLPRNTGGKQKEKCNNKAYKRSGC